MSTHKIAEKLIREGQKLEQFFSNLNESQLEICVYLDEQEWQIRDVLAHFISAEKSFLLLFESIRIGGQGVTDDFSITEFNDLQVLKMKNIDPEDLLVLFGETRMRTVKWVKGLSEEETAKSGRHPAMGDTTLREMIKMVYLHNQMHLRDIRAAIESHLLVNE